MPTLTTEAEAAYTVVLTSEANAAENERKALRTAAADAVKAILVKPDGTRFTPADFSLTVKDTDLRDGRVVYSDGTINLASILRDGVWKVHLVALVDGGWTRTSDRLNSLADLGAALAASRKVA